MAEPVWILSLGSAQPLGLCCVCCRAPASVSFLQSPSSLQLCWRAKRRGCPSKYCLGFILNHSLGEILCQGLQAPAFPGPMVGVAQSEGNSSLPWLSFGSLTSYLHRNVVLCPAAAASHLRSKEAVPEDRGNNLTAANFRSSGSLGSFEQFL